jgi:AcrR family transcriptional regulator
MGATKQRTEVRRRQIARAALRLMARRGAGGLRIGALARSVGLVPSAVYRHFRGRDAVMDLVLDYVRDELMANVAAVRTQARDPLKRLHRLLRRHVRLIVQNRAILRVVFSEDVFGESPRRREQVRALMHDYLGAVAELFQEGQQAGRVRRDAEPRTLALMFLGLIQPAALLWHLSGKQLPVAVVTEQAWEIFSESVATKPKEERR